MKNIFLINNLCSIFDKSVLATISLDFEEADKQLLIYNEMLHLNFSSESEFHEQLLLLIDAVFISEHQRLCQPFIKVYN